MNFTARLILLFILFISSTHTVIAAGNLIPNPTFENIAPNGDPKGWLRGGYGENARSHSVTPCRYYTEADLLLDPSSPNFVFRPTCPPYAKFILTTEISNYVDGDSKWYFKDIQIGAKKKFSLSYYYQPYTYAGKVIARYKLSNGTYQYVHIANMPQLVAGGNGYIGWSKGVQEFTAPPNAKSLTIFFAVEGGGTCGEHCLGPNTGKLSIANVTLEAKK